MQPRDLTRGLAIAAGVVTIILTGAAFALSYEHLARVAMANGVEHQVAAWAWPGTVDLFIMAGEILILRAVIQGRKDPFAVFLTIVGSLGSIALNVLGVGGGHPAMHYVVAGVPPVAALLAFGAVMRQIHELVSVRMATEADTEPDAGGQVSALPAAAADMAAGLVDMWPELSELVAKTPDIVAEETADMSGQGVGTSLPVSGQVDIEADTPAVTSIDEDTHAPTKPVKGPDMQQIRDAAAAIDLSGETVTGTTLAAHFGVSGRTGRRYADRLKADMATATATA